MVPLLNNRYKPEKMLGHGGMGRVYLMTDIQTQQRVAVKECFCPQEDNAVERIKREYYFMTKIQHPYLVHGIDFFQIQNRYFIVMEYVEGITIKNLIREHPHSVSLEKQLQIAAQICDAVATLNSNGVVHRDIKPDNIILTTSDLTPKLLDFGIAKAINGELVTITKTENIIGTPGYMAPEQIDPRITLCDNLDVFSLGIVFYQFLAWLPESPFYTGQIVSTIDRIMHFELPSLFPNATPAKQQYISQVISWALRKNPSERIESVRELQKLICGDHLEQRILPQSNGNNLVALKPAHTKKAILKSTRYLRIAFLVLMNIIVIFLLIARSPVAKKTLMKEYPATYQSNSLNLLGYYNLEINTQEGMRQKRAYARRGRIFYQMRQLQAQYMEKARQDGQKMENVESNLFLLRIEIVQLILQAKMQKSLEVRKSAEKISQRCLSLKEHRKTLLPQEREFVGCVEKIIVHCLGNAPQNILVDTGYGDLYLACTSSFFGDRISYLHKAQLLIPDEERVYLELLDAYIECGFYEKAQEMYSVLKNMNGALVETDFLMAKKHLLTGNFAEVKKTFATWKANFWQQQTSWVQVLLLKYFLATKDEELAKRTLQNIKETDLEVKDKFFVKSLQSYYQSSTMSCGQYLILADVWIKQDLFSKIPNLLKAARKLLDGEQKSDDNLQRLKGLYALRELQLTIREIMADNSNRSQKIRDVGDKIKAIVDVGKEIELFKHLLIANFRIWCVENNVKGMPELNEKRLNNISDDYLFFGIKARDSYYQQQYATAIVYWEKANRILPSLYFINMQKRAFTKLAESKKNEAPRSK